jgi:SAM-dependent methyltransferase
MKSRAPAYELTRCLVCGSADSREVAGTDEVRSEVETLWAFHGRRLRPATPPEHLMDRVAFSEHPPFRVVACKHCGFVYRNPIEREYELAEIYAGDAPAPDVLQSLHETQRRSYRAQATRVLREVGRDASGLEVGSYVGAFLAAARDVGLYFEGVDINRDVNRFTRSLGFAVHDGGLEQFESERRFDVVSIWNTFDQVPRPRAVANAAWRHLRPGGMLTLRVPNGAFYEALRVMLRDAPDQRGVAPPIRRGAARLALAHNNLLTFPYRFGFTARSITLLLSDIGFCVQHIHGDVLVPIADEWTKLWASMEERAVKGVLGVLARRKTAWAPWLEVYARKERS